MKKSGVLHAELAKIVARLGHGQTIVISDYGLPIPAGPVFIDLAVRSGVPSFLEVLDTVLEELAVEECVVASELADGNAELVANVQDRVRGTMSYVAHELFKTRVAEAVAVVRTGEHTPYANIILKAGVVF